MRRAGWAKSRTVAKSPGHGKGHRVGSGQGRLMAVFRWRHFTSYRELEEMIGRQFLQ